MAANNNQFIFRRAAIPDIKIVREMIQELADFERMTNGPRLTERDLINDAGLNGGTEYCHIYICELQRETPIAIGYAICFFGYSTWRGKSYFLEDIYIRPDYRKLGAGGYLFHQIAAMAKQHNCKRLDFHVLAWNPANLFYKKLGAANLTETEEWHYYRVNEDQIDKLIDELPK